MLFRSRDTIRMLGQALHDTLGFDATATEVDTPVADAFAGRKGVCQDFAQIMIAGLRALGIPACYAAGFLRTLPPAGQPRLQGADAMHAWVRAWAGGETGWLDYDPTNACFVDSDHITVSGNTISATSGGNAAGARELGATQLALVSPYLAYMRQDMAFTPGEAVSQRHIAALLAIRVVLRERTVGAGRRRPAGSRAVKRRSPSASAR